MIITQTPFRISFFGGGTDIQSFFSKEGGQVLSTTIDKYCYVTIRDLPPFFDHSIRLAYSRLETCASHDDIQHPLIRAILEDFDRNNVEIHYDADLPGNSGLGSSSSFGVGLVTSLLGLSGRIISKQETAERVIYYERKVLKEHGGYQDQVAAAYGGFNHIKFYGEDNFSVNPFPLSGSTKKALLQRLILLYIPKKRFSSDVSVAQGLSKDKKSYWSNLQFIYDSVDKAMEFLQKGDFDSLGELMHETWMRKRKFSGVADDEINAVYDQARAAGAIGGKLLGAGGGGFMLLFSKAEQRDKIIREMSPLLVVPFEFEDEGSKIIYYKS